MRHRSLSLRLFPFALMCGTIACGLGSTALAASAGSGAPPVASDSRVKTFVFNENDVYSLLTYYGFQSNIEFGPKEKIETVSIGDRAGWQVVPAGRRLFIRAVADNLHTNMTVVTNERAYQFDLRATNPAELPQEELAYVIRFYYPDDPKNRAPATAAVPAAPMAAPTAPMAYPTGMAASAPVPSVSPAMAPMNTPISSSPLPMPNAAPNNNVLPAPQPKPSMAASMRDSALSPPPSTKNQYGAGPFDTPLSSLPAASAPNPAPVSSAKTNGAMNFNYTYEGNGQLLPYALFDDGKRTYFQFLNTDAVPTLSRVSSSGKETPVPLKREGNYWVAGGVGAKFVLRSQGQTGGQQVVIYNETRQPK